MYMKMYLYIMYVVNSLNDFEIKQISIKLPLKMFFRIAINISVNFFVLCTAFEILFCTFTKINCTIKSLAL